MDSEWLIIPEYDRLDESVALAAEYNAAFEYNDFYLPKIYQNKDKTEEVIRTYLGLERDRSRDTLHGAFLDLAPSAMDSVIKEYSRELMEQSMEIGERLGVRGVVFHSGLVSGVENKQYIENWFDCMEDIFRDFAREFPNTEIYLENTVERIPDFHVSLVERMKDVKNMRLCLDYAHAVLMSTENEAWVQSFAPYIGHIHLNDNDLKSDLHAVPGKGLIDYCEMETYFERYSVKAPILLELRGIEAQREALEFMLKL